MNKNVMQNFVDDCRDESYLLKLRDYLAENGIELTPDELRESCNYAEDLLTLSEGN